MKFKDLREYIAFLESKGDLRRIKTPVNPELEITEIADRVIKSGGPALLFESPQGFDIPVLINMFGSEQRMGLGLGSGPPRRRGSKGTKPAGTDARSTGGAAQQIAHPGSTGPFGFLPTQDGGPCPLPGRDSAGGRRRSLQIPHHQVLALGWRSVHHPTPRHHQRPSNRGSKLRHIPAAGLRPADHRYALADPQGRHPSLPAQPRVRDWRKSTSPWR